MSVDSGVIDRNGRSFFIGNVGTGSVGWGFLGFEDFCKSEMHGEELCEIRDGIRFSAVSGTYFVDGKLVDFTCAASDDYNMEILSKANAVGRKRDAKKVV